MLVVAAGCGGGSSSDGDGGGTGGGPHKGGILRVGSINYIDSLNPFHYIESQSYQAMLMIYPAARAVRAQGDDKLVIEGDWADSWETSADGKDWTFNLKPGSKWSDGQPLTANDAAWTINTIVKYANGPTAVAAAALAHVTERRGDGRQHARHPLRRPGRERARRSWSSSSSSRSTSGSRWSGANGKGLKTFQPEQNLPFVTGGRLHDQGVREEGHDRLHPGGPNYYGEPPTPRPSRSRSSRTRTR